jgi:hypothetical protein
LRQADRDFDAGPCRVLKVEVLFCFLDNCVAVLASFASVDCIKTYNNNIILLLVQLFFYREFPILALAREDQP